MAGGLDAKWTVHGHNRDKESRSVRETEMQRDRCGDQEEQQVTPLAGNRLRRETWTETSLLDSNTKKQLL